MAKEDLVAHVQNDEMVGTVAGDESKPLGADGLREFAEKCGVDVQKYEPFGVDVYGEEGGEESVVSILAVDKTVLGDPPAIEDYVLRNGPLPYTRFSTTGALRELLRYIKRLNFILIHRRFEVSKYIEVHSEFIER
jgi:hypothetical protein